MKLTVILLDDTRTDAIHILKWLTGRVRITLRWLTAIWTAVFLARPLLRPLFSDKAAKSRLASGLRTTCISLPPLTGRLTRLNLISLLIPTNDTGLATRTILTQNAAGSSLNRRRIERLTVTATAIRCILAGIRIFTATHAVIFGGIFAGHGILIIHGVITIHDILGTTILIAISISSTVIITSASGEDEYPRTQTRQNHRTPYLHLNSPFYLK
jgi:hypothetical protein